MSHAAVAAGSEKIRTVVHDDSADVNRAVAAEVAALVRSRAAVGKRCVLGLATGSTPTGVYDELVRLHRDEGLSFANVVTFNLDEYYPMRPAELQSYHRFMREHLFDRIDIPPQNVHIPDGTVPIERVADYCLAYEQADPRLRRHRPAAAGHRPDRARRVQRAGQQPR